METVVGTIGNDDVIREVNVHYITSIFEASGQVFICFTRSE